MSVPVRCSPTSASRGEDGAGAAPRSGDTARVTEHALPQTVRDLIAQHLASVEHVEVLLSLSGEEGEARSSDELALQLQRKRKAITVRLDDLVASGLVARDTSGGATKFRFAPRTPVLRKAVEDLAEMYRTKPVSLIKAIYDRPASAVRSFADAFRLRDQEP